MTNSYNAVLYIGVTSNLEKRVWEHKNSVNKNSFTYKYNCNKLVHYEIFTDIRFAISREKQFKNWKREWKNELISKANSEWNDLSELWHQHGIAGQARNDDKAAVATTDDLEDINIAKQELLDGKTASF